HPQLADLAVAEGMVGVVAQQGREVEGDAEARLALLQQVFEAPVGLGRRAVTGELAHGPQAAAVHGLVRAPGEGVPAGVAQVPGVVDGGVFGTVDGLDGLAREGEELPAASGTGAGRRGTLRTGCRAIRGLRGSVHDNDLP